MPPVYYPLRDAILNNNRQLVEGPLVHTENGCVMDYKGFEEKIMGHDVKLFILCSSHNPVGRVRRSEEIQRALDICEKHHVYVVSGEIHRNIIIEGHEYVVAATTETYDDILVTFTAGIKTSNLAACQDSVLVIPDQGLWGRYDQYLKRLRINGGSALDCVAVQSAYGKGRGRLEQVLDITEANYRYMRNALLEALTDVWVSELEGTYLIRIDLGKYIKPEDMKHVIQDKCGLAMDYGSWFDEDEYDGFIRINLATSKENVELATRNIVWVLKHVWQRIE